MKLILIIVTIIAVLWTAIVVVVNSQWEKRLGTDGLIIAWVILPVTWLSWWLG